MSSAGVPQRGPVAAKPTSDAYTAKNAQFAIKIAMNKAKENTMEDAMLRGKLTKLGFPASIINGKISEMTKKGELKFADGKYTLCKLDKTKNKSGSTVGMTRNNQHRF